MKKKLLTMNDLVQFFSSNNISKFSSNDTGYKLCVQVPATFEIDDTTDDDHRGMMKLKVKVFHTGLNRNGSYVSEEAAKAAMPTIKNRPLLAHIHQLDSGEYDFETHNMNIIENEDGTQEIEYIEKQVGSFAESEPFFEYDEDLDKTFVCAYAYISEEYTKAADIVRRKGGTKNSCELSIEELSYNAKEKYLDLESFYVSASTLLGSLDDGTEIKEGMEGSRADIVDFSQENNSVLSLDMHMNAEKLIETLEKLNTTLSNFNIDDNQRKEETDVEENIMLENEELVEEVIETNESTEEGMETEVVEETTENFIEETPEEVDEDQNENPEENFEAVSVKPEKYSIVMSDGNIIEFNLSLDEITCALYTLVNNTYGESDNTYYSVQVFEDGTLVMIDYWANKAYRQSYNRENDVFTLIGDRIEVFSNWLTREEEASLNEMRSNYSSIKDALDKYESAELKAKKENIFNKKEYVKFLETEEFKTLISDIDNYSVDELAEKAELAFSKCVQRMGFSLSDNEEDTKVFVGRKVFPTNTTKKKGRYGSMLSSK